MFELIRDKIADRAFIDGVEGVTTSLAISALGLQDRSIFLWICNSNRQLEATASDLTFFTEGLHPVVTIPGFEADPYRGLSSHPSIGQARAEGLRRVLDLQRGFVVTTLHSLISRLPSPTLFRQFEKCLTVGKTCPLGGITSYLQQAGYIREETVSQKGEYSKRGGIVDIFSPLQRQPFRVEFFGDEIDSIRLFDPSSQRSIKLLNKCKISPIREQPVFEEDLGKWSKIAPGFWKESRFAPDLEEKLQFTERGEVFSGYEYLLPLVWNNRSSLFDFLAGGTRSHLSIVLSNADSLMNQAGHDKESYRKSYEKRWEAGELVLRPQQLFFDLHRLLRQQESGGANLIRTYDFHEISRDSVHFDFLPPQKLHGRFNKLTEEMESISGRKNCYVFVAKTRVVVKKLVDIFRQYGIELKSAENFWEALRQKRSVCQGQLSAGFSSKEFRLKVFVAEELFAELPARQRERSKSWSATAVFRSDFQDLKPGNLVVHIEHGIGRFVGLKNISVEGLNREFIELSYLGKSSLFVPADRVDLLQKYSTIEDKHVSLDRLGGTTWKQTKKKIKKSLREMAGELLKLYARRELVQGHCFSGDDSLMQEFEASFEYEETPDQLVAINELKKDMESRHPMDRLICGDVGYGKTEIAMRAAFKSVNDGFQVAVLAPTTILASQHYNTFKKRFSAFPVCVEMLSRFCSRKDSKRILVECKEGIPDIIIGTHRLLSRDVNFRKLGLLIIDEEQRFGVSQKEKIKSMRTQVDVLSLTATPIPRTLHLSILGLRDLSVIETPPKNRLSIQTVVVAFSDKIIRSAIDLELKRKGQVFFVHNSVETIYSMANLVSKAVPKARVGVAHGQLQEKELEKVMLKFVNHEFDVLVCTTIIENGLDIPRANTLIVNRADHFGLSQLYQLRGRVGRSHRRAYAYLLIPSREVINTIARKRLAAIREFSDLGAGFRIAAHDLELRGAGNLLGAEQHGHINAVGFDLYTKLLSQTVSELRGEPWLENWQVSVDIGLDIQIPIQYIEDATLRLWLYKKAAGITDEMSVKTLQFEVKDRFGKYPQSVENLFEYARLRIKARQLGVSSIRRIGDHFHIQCRNDSPIDLKKLVDILQNHQDINLSPQGVLVRLIQAQQPGEIVVELWQFLNQIPVLE